MAFLQSDIPPSTAPGSPVRTVRARRAVAPVRHGSVRPLGWLAAALVATGALAIIGIAAARATESFAVGILAADLAFLIAVAGWSAVARGARR